MLPYADYYGLLMQHARLASLLARATTPWTGLRPSDSSTPNDDDGSSSNRSDNASDDIGLSLPFPLHNVSLAEMGFFYYLEANLLASPPLPTSASYVLAAFPKLFGSSEGLRVVRWAAAKGWPLAWGLGASLNRGVAYPPNLNASWAANGRLWDPRSAALGYRLNLTAAAATSPAGAKGATLDHGASAGATAATAFEAAWQAVAAERASAEAAEAAAQATGGVDGTAVAAAVWSTADFARWWALASSAAGPGLAFEPLLPGRCVSGPSQCVGLVLSDGDCICAR
jgi:hypothetical protein